MSARYVIVVELATLGIAAVWVELGPSCPTNSDYRSPGGGPGLLRQ